MENILFTKNYMIDLKSITAIKKIRSDNDSIVTLTIYSNGYSLSLTSVQDASDIDAILERFNWKD